jgi:hypothetical protein
MKLLRVAVAWLVLCGQAVAAPGPGPTPQPVSASSVGQPGGVPQLDQTAHLSPSQSPASMQGLKAWRAISRRA